MHRSIVEAAAANEFQSLIGMREDQTFEAKHDLPDLTSATGRWELAKDAVAMANGGGGLIVYGLSTRKIPSEQSDEVSDIHPIHRVAARLEAAVSVIGEHANPKLAGLRIDFVPADGDREKGLILLEVPAQRSKVLLCKPMEGSETLKGFLFGFVERDHDATKNLTCQQVSEMLRSGTSSVSARLDAVEQAILRVETLVSTAKAPVQVPADNSLLDSRIEDTISDV